MEFAELGYWIAHYGYAAIFVLLALGIIGLPIPDETLLTLTGYLVFKGSLDPGLSYVSALSGSICGISVSFALGRFGGAALVRRFGSWLHLSKERLARAHDWFEGRGHWTLTLGYFVPGFRHIVAIIAGSSRMRTSQFALFAYAGAAIWSATFILAGYYLGEEWRAFPGMMHRAAIILFVAVVVVIGSLHFIRTRRSG